MKKLLCIITFTLSFINVAKAQTDYCKDIKTTDDKTMSYIGYHSPILEPISVGADISRESGRYKSTFLTFSIYNKTADYDAVGLYVIFTDGSIWKDESADIHCSYENADLGYGFTGVYMIQTEEDLKTFQVKKVKSIKVGKLTSAISDEYAIKFMAYVKCIADLKN